MQRGKGVVRVCCGEETTARITHVSTAKDKAKERLESAGGKVALDFVAGHPTPCKGSQLQSSRGAHMQDSQRHILRVAQFQPLAMPGPGDEVAVQAGGRAHESASDAHARPLHTHSLKDQASAFFFICVCVLPLPSRMLSEEEELSRLSLDAWKASCRDWLKGDSRCSS